MTQTTAGRITEIIREHLKFYAGSGEWAAAVEAGQEIAAEIDALTRERDEARAEVDGLAAQLSSADRSREATEDRLNRLESALAIAGIYPFAGDYAAAVYALHGDVIAVRAALDRAVGERDEARAEAERLRLAAEAWEARYRWGKTIDGTAESVKAQIAMEDAEDQAAAAKEAKP